MKSPFWPSFTETWHDKSYPAISPSNPSLSAKDKTVVITGGGTGIGASIARAFAAAGAPRIAILSRTEANLLATKHDLESRFPGTQVLAVPADITDAEQLRKAFAQIRQAFGKLDVFFCNSAYMSSPKPALSPDLDVNDWRFAFETNVLGALNSVRAFMEHAADNAALLHVSTGIAHIPPVVSGVAAYAASKAAATKIFDFIAFENPALHVVNIQPGLIDTQTSRKSGHGGMDHIDLPGDFCLWLTSPEASFLRGKFVWVNWDVDELKARKEEIAGTDLLNVKLEGLSFDGWTGNADEI